MLLRWTIPIFFALLFASAIAVALLGGALAWDGAYYLFQVLDLGVPFTPLGRNANVVLQAPVLAARSATDDLRLLRVVFALPYTLAPVLGLALSWAVVRRRRPSLFVWPALFTGLAVLPGQFFATSEGYSEAALFWPLLLAVLVGASWRWALALAALGVWLWVAHPLFAVFAVATAGAAAVAAVRRPTQRVALATAAVALLVAAVLRSLVPLSGYEAESLSVQRLRDAFQVSVRGWPLVSLAFTAVAAVLLLVQRWLPGWAAIWRYAPALAALAAGAALIPWARDAYAWAHSLDFRFWVGPLALAFMFAAGMETFGPSRRETPSGLWQARLATVLAIGIAVSAVQVVQARAWNIELGKLSSAMAASPRRCMNLHDLEWVGGNPMEHWATTPLSIVLQGRTPTTLVLADGNCERMAQQGAVPIAPGYLRPPSDGWFDLSRPASS